MSRKTRLRDEDPVVEEIRVIRARIWRRAGGTGQGLMRLLRESAKDHKQARHGKSRPVTRKRRAATPRPRTR